MSLTKSINFALGLIGVLVLASGISYWYYFTFLPSQSESVVEFPTLKEYPVIHPQSVQNSRLFLTMALGVGDFQLPTLFHSSAEEGMVMRYSTFTAVTEKVSPDGQVTALVAYPSTFFMEEFGIPVDIIQVMIKDNQGILTPLTFSTSTPHKFYPTWSPDGQRIAFMASSSIAEVMPLGEPEFWDIYITNLEGEEERVGSGAYPQWSADSLTLFVLKSDGIYSIDVETGMEEVQYKTDTTLDWSSSISSDRNQRYLSLAMPTEDKVYIFEFTENELSLAKELPWGGNSIVFSPDGSVIAVLYKTEADIYPQLAFVNWRLDETLEKLSLEGFSKNTIMLTDWVQNR